MARLPSLEPFAHRSSAAIPSDPGPEPADDHERCQLCAAVVEAEHSHLLDRRTGELRCACRACTLLFDGRVGVRAGHLRLLPRRVLYDPALTVTPAEAVRAGLPVQLAAVRRVTGEDGGLGLLALYPSPAGPIEEELDVARFALLADRSPLFRVLEPDVETLLFRRRRDGTALDCLLAPLDAGFELVGLVRLHFRGGGGGDEARAAVDRLFARLGERAVPVDAATPPAVAPREP